MSLGFKCEFEVLQMVPRRSFVGVSFPVIDSNPMQGGTDNQQLLMNE